MDKEGKLYSVEVRRNGNYEQVVAQFSEFSEAKAYLNDRYQRLTESFLSEDLSVKALMPDDVAYIVSVEDFLFWEVAKIR